MLLTGGFGEEESISKKYLQKGVVNEERTNQGRNRALAPSFTGTKRTSSFTSCTVTDCSFPRMPVFAFPPIFFVGA